MKLVCIGVGGSGAACLEVVVHMAALGLFGNDCEIVPIALDPDKGHPRINGMSTFLVAYERLRHAGNARDLNNGELFGTRIVRNQSLNATKPADFESLYREGRHLFRQGKYQQAIKFFERSLTLDPDRADVHDATSHSSAVASSKCSRES